MYTNKKNTVATHGKISLNFLIIKFFIQKIHTHVLDTRSKFW
jgi:hypothetical protein